MVAVGAIVVVVAVVAVVAVILVLVVSRCTGSELGFELFETEV